MFALLALTVQLGAGGREIVVQPGTAVPTIAAALAGARDGDTIRIRPGTYRESGLTIARQVALEGDGWPVVDGGGAEILLVTADSVSIRGLVFQHVAPVSTEDRAAIRLREVRHCRIEDNRIRQSFFGVYLMRVTGCRIGHNEITGTASTEALTGNAIHSWSSTGLEIVENDLRAHRDGIYLEFTGASTIRGNASRDMVRYGLHFMFSDGNRYEENRFEGNGAGVAVMYSRHVTITGNRFAGSRGSAAYGLLLKDIAEATVAGNHFADNSVGLSAEGTTRVEVRDNEFVRNGWAVRVMANAVATRFVRNRFAGNSFDVATNSTLASSEFEGNFWDRYRGYDLDRDGVGDVPFAPVRLFALVVQHNEPALILQRSLIVTLLDLAERVAPALTPQTMIDRKPAIRWAQR